MAKLINRGWLKPGDEIPQPIGIVMGTNLRQNAEPPKPERPPSKTLSGEQERLVAEIKRHHPMATTEGILRELEAWGVEYSRLLGFALCERGRGACQASRSPPLLPH